MQKRADTASSVNWSTNSRHWSIDHQYSYLHRRLRRPVQLQTCTSNKNQQMLKNANTARDRQVHQKHFKEKKHSTKQEQSYRSHRTRGDRNREECASEQPRRRRSH